MSIRKHPAWLTGIALLTILLYFLFLDEYNAYRLLRLQEERETLKQAVASNIKRQEQLSLEIRWLESDSSYIEKIARERFRMGLRGERVYIFQAEDNH